MESMVSFYELKETYGGKKVFLTGHTGFKGAWLLVILNMLGAEVKAFALPPEDEPNLYNLTDGKQLCQEEVMGDIRDAEKLRNEIAAFAPDFVFHLAAQSLVRRSYEFAIETYAVNVLGTAHVLDALRYLKKPCTTVIVTTDKVYENREWEHPYREIDALGGYDPYSSSKACAEVATASWRRSFFHPDAIDKHGQGIATARAGNVIGGGDWAQDRIIPDLVRALEKEETLIVRNPKAVRPWEHVLEPLSGYLLLGKKLSENPQGFASNYNFGPFAEDNLTVESLVRLSVNIWGKGDYRIEQNPDAPHEAGLLKLDISKAVHELGWCPRWNATQALEATLGWYKQVMLNHEKPLEVTRKQIAAYFSAH